ncbi:FecR family protein [Pedobacter caeni]|uniref:FecR family protein n=1 Tax=Pedobacter caeni TaxID=288992 RepID=A0A1M5HNW2_9SPHI|nr:FecR domain-containing protein [Pedobacter caeni]SHG17653.1 FecR family protein [Pedobacter caeni]
MKKHDTDFNSYSLLDFLDDPDFMAWVLTPTLETDLHWETVLNNYPASAENISAAKKLILSLSFSVDEMDAKELEEVWENITEETRVNKPKTRILPLWLKAASAAVLAGILLTAGLYFYTHRQIEVSTQYGQVKTIQLPDGSEVTLNANSTLQYAGNWDKKEIREVWIKGEAQFNVNHLHLRGPVKTGDRFVVHSQKVNIEVLGTSFNVNNRRGLEQVSLLSGKISLTGTSGNKPVIIMKPGEIVQYMNNEITLFKAADQVSEYISWSKGKLFFQNTTLSKVFQYLEDVHGYQVILKDPEIGNKKISGAFDSNNIRIMFSALSMALNINIKEDTSLHQLTVSY